MRILKIPDGKGNRRKDLTPEDIALNEELGRRFERYGYSGGPVEKISTTNYIADGMEPTRHMATGEMYDSKSAFRAKTKELGLIEIGNEIKSLTRKPQEVSMDKRSRVEAIQKAIYQIRNK